MLPRVSDINLNLLIMLIYKVTNKINGKVYVGVKDTRTIGKVLGVSGRRDIINKLKELIKMYADPADE